MNINLAAELHRAQKADPVADLARLLVSLGVSEDQLCTELKKIKGVVSTVVVCELRNKFRDVTRGVPTFNHYGIRQ
jgi:Mn-dependent DtxR family transcriptional regulator